MGLREEKKTATREQLARAALRLALDRGLENVRVEDIAAAANVSPRTFNNYFASKEEAIVALNVERAVLTGEALKGRPAGEPLAEALTHAIAGQYETPADPEHAQRVRLLLSSPAIRGAYLASLVAAERPLAEAIAERTGEHGAYPRVLAAAVSGAARAAVAHWAASASREPLADAVRDALTRIVAGVR